MRQALKIAFDTRQLKADIRVLQATITSMEEEFARLIEENQARMQDQGEYLARFEKAESDYQRAQTKKEVLETEVRQRASRYKTILAAYNQFLDSGSALVIEPCQFNGLIDHASVTAELIQFAFKSGHEIEINLD